MHPVLIYSGLYFVLQILVFVVLELTSYPILNPKVIFGGPIGFAAIIGTWLLKEQNKKPSKKKAKKRAHNKVSI